MPWSSRRSCPAGSTDRRRRARPGPGVRVGLDDEGAQRVADRIGVGGEDTVGAVLVDEREPVEHVGGAEPDELRARHLGGRSEVVGEQVRKRLLAPSHTTTRSKSSSSAGSRTSCWNRDLHALGAGPFLQQARAASCVRPPPCPCRRRAPVHPCTRTSMSSQCRPCFSSASLRTGSAASMASSVASEKTTPKPNVSSGRLRSKTTTSASGRLRFSRVAKNSPPGPPPMQATFMAFPSRSQPRGQCRQGCPAVGYRGPGTGRPVA